MINLRKWYIQKYIVFVLHIWTKLKAMWLGTCDNNWTQENACVTGIIAIFLCKKYQILLSHFIVVIEFLEGKNICMYDSGDVCTVSESAWPCSALKDSEKPVILFFHWCGSS